jgi:hypothetical protein
MTRQGKVGFIGWCKDFLHGLRIAWDNAWGWQGIYKLEIESARLYPARMKVMWSGLERRASEKRIDEKLAALDAKKEQTSDVS